MSGWNFISIISHSVTKKKNLRTLLKWYKVKQTLMGGLGSGLNSEGVLLGIRSHKIIAHTVPLISLHAVA